MADIKHIIPFTYKWEGGLTDNPKDNASSDPAPWPYTITRKGKPYTSGKWHTNKGITHTTFKSNAKDLGYEYTAKNFFEMPESIWLSIAKKKYWDSIKLDTYTSQAIANLMFSWRWGSGYAWRARMQRYLLTKGISWNINDFTALATALNSLAKKNEQQTFEELVKQKELFLRSLSDFDEFGDGWLNRLKSLKDMSMSFITAHAGASVAGAFFFGSHLISLFQ